MRRFQLGAFVALTAAVFVAASTGVAPAAVSPSATGSQALVSGSPSAIACGGSVDARVTVNATAGSTGAATNVVLVIDLSSSTAAQVAAEKAAALDALSALDAADGATDSAIAGNRAGIVSYQGTTATTRAVLGSSYSALVTAVNTLPASSTGSPHGAGINAAATLLAGGGAGFTRSLVLITDGQAGASEISNATAAANAAKGSGVRIIPLGVGSANTANLQSWASSPGYYQSASGPINKTKLITDLDALVAVPTTFTVTETLGANFSAAPLGSPAGTVTTAPGSLTWTGTIAGNGSATLDYRATRNGTDVFAATTEVVSTMALAVTGGTATVTPPAAISIDVLPCGGTPLATTTCTGRRLQRQRHAGRRAVLGQRGLAAGRHAGLAVLAEHPDPAGGGLPRVSSRHAGGRVRHPAALDGRDVPHRDPEGVARQPAVVPDQRLPRHQPALHHRDLVARESLPGRDVRLRRLPARPLVGIAAEHSARRLVPGPRLRARAVHHEPRRGTRPETRHHVPGAVRRRTLRA